MIETKAQLYAEIDAEFPDNSAGQITEAKLRAFLKKTVDREDLALAAMGIATASDADIDTLTALTADQRQTLKDTGVSPKQIEAINAASAGNPVTSIVAITTGANAGGFTVTHQDTSTTTIPPAVTYATDAELAAETAARTAVDALKADKTELHPAVTLGAGSDPALVINGQEITLTLPSQIDLTVAEPAVAVPDPTTATQGVVYVVASDGAYVRNAAGDAMLKVADLATVNTLTTVEITSTTGTDYDVEGLVSARRLDDWGLSRRVQRIFDQIDRKSVV